MDPWRRIVGGDTASKDYQQGEIFESAILDEGQELGITREKWILCQFAGENCEGPQKSQTRSL
jgi:hypothetical protein